jgi:hypothetical protein
MIPECNCTFMDTRSGSILLQPNCKPVAMDTVWCSQCDCVSSTAHRGQPDSWYHIIAPNTHHSSLKLINIYFTTKCTEQFLSPFQCHHMTLMDFMVSPPGCGRSEVGTPMRRSYVVPMKCMVIYEYEVPRRALNLSSNNLPRLWSPWKSSPSRKNSQGRAGNRARDLMTSSQKLWPLDHEAGCVKQYS